MDFGWKYYLLLLAILLVIVATIPIYISRLNHAMTRGAAREWISAYGGLLAIAAAMIAAIPVFQQLDEARLATKNEKILLTAGAQKALDDERARVMEIEKIAETLKILLRSKDTKSIDAEIAGWKVHDIDVDQEMKSKTDKLPLLYKQRADLAERLDVFVQVLDEIERNGSTETNVEQATADLLKSCEAYVIASHKEVEFLHRRIAENEGPLLGTDISPRP